MFLVVSGEFYMQFRDRTVRVGEGGWEPQSLGPSSRTGDAGVSPAPKNLSTKILPLSAQIPDNWMAIRRIQRAFRRNRLQQFASR
jgi:hypothetical protein